MWSKNININIYLNVFMIMFLAHLFVFTVML